ncbi:hypothetical protein SAMN02910358_02475 [Lachnospiraceae bacterium XBB1006]|nr:hypothetical protein SAMN02910358_02475 [Lachnospiraceae bacterium XBB1006]
MEKTLGIIQTFSKIGKILSRIAYICFLVGGIACLISLCSLEFGNGEAFKLGGVAIHGFIEEREDMQMAAIYPAVINGAIGCAGGYILARLFAKYFKHELEAGTPFTMEGAKELRRLGIFFICVPIIARAVMEIVFAILTRTLDVSEKLDVMEDVSGVGIGITLIAVSFLCQYGAECLVRKK